MYIFLKYELILESLKYFKDVEKVGIYNITLAICQNKHYYKIIKNYDQENYN